MTRSATGPTRITGRPAAVVAWVGAVLVVAAGLAGCGSSGPPDAAAPGPTRTVVDMTGRAVQIPAVVTRVGTNIPLVAPTLALLGRGQTLVAAPTGTSSPLTAAVAPTPPGTLVSPVNSINADALLTARPQVFIMTTLTPGLRPTLDRLGIPVVQLAGFTTPADLQHAVGVLGDVLGGDAAARARQFDSYAGDILNRVQGPTASLPPAARPTVYYAPGPSPTTTVGNGNIITAAIIAAGGRNVAAEHGLGANQPGAFAFPSISPETLLSWNPQVVVAINATVAASFRSDPAYAELDAVRAHRVYVCPQGVFAWCASSGEAALAPLFLAKTLHPELFPTLDLAAATRDFYATFYRYPLSAPQVTGILNGS